MGILKGLTITAIGDVGAKPEQLRRWIEANGGKWVPRVSKGLTHLICSKEAWKKGGDAVTAAQKANAHVVSYDWLEDSLQGKRKLGEKKFLWTTLTKERRKSKEMKRVGKKADSSKFLKGCEKACEDIGSGTSSSRKSSSRSTGGFFRSSLAALKEAREKREREAKARTDENAEDKPDHVTDLTGEGVAEDEALADAEAEEGAVGGRSEQASPRSLQSPSRSSSTKPSPNLSSSSQKPSSTPQPKAKTSPKVLPTPPSSTTRSSFGRPSTPQNPIVQQSVPLVPKTERLTDNYHIFLDRTGFEYNITLIRANLFRNTHARYTLRIFESHTKPHVYCTFIRYQPPAQKEDDDEDDDDGESEVMKTRNGVPPMKGRTTSSMTTKYAANGETETGGGMHPKLLEAMRTLNQSSTPSSPPPPAEKPFRQLLVPVNSSYDIAFSAFRFAFKELTFLTWEERLLPTLREIQADRAKHCGLEPFLYVTPRVGLPLGIACPVPLPPLAQVQNIMNLAGLGIEKLELPGVNVKLSCEGTVGLQIFRAEQEAKRKAEEEEQRKMESERLMQRQKRGLKLTVGIRKDHRRPPITNIHSRGIVGNVGGYGGYAGNLGRNEVSRGGRNASLPTSLGASRPETAQNRHGGGSNDGSGRNGVIRGVSRTLYAQAPPGPGRSSMENTRQAGTARRMGLMGPMTNAPVFADTGNRWPRSHFFNRE